MRDSDFRQQVRRFVDFLAHLRPRMTLLACILLAFSASFFARFVAVGGKTMLSLYMSIIAAKVAEFWFETPQMYIWARILSYFFNLALFSIPAFGIFLLFGKRRPALCSLSLVLWLICYLPFLLFFFPAR